MRHDIGAAPSWPLAVSLVTWRGQDGSKGTITTLSLLGTCGCANVWQQVLTGALGR